MGVDRQPARLLFQMRRAPVLVLRFDPGKLSFVEIGGGGGFHGLQRGSRDEIAFFQTMIVYDPRFAAYFQNRLIPARLTVAPPPPILGLMLTYAAHGLGLRLTNPAL